MGTILAILLVCIVVFLIAKGIVRIEWSTPKAKEAKDSITNLAMRLREKVKAEKKDDEFVGFTNRR